MKQGRASQIIEIECEVEERPGNNSGGTPAYACRTNGEDEKLFWPGYRLNQHSREDAERDLERTLHDLQRVVRKLALIDLWEKERDAAELKAHDERKRKAAATRAKNRDPFGFDAILQAQEG